MRDARRTSVMVAARVAPEEREAIARLAWMHDRTPSREVRRAIRFYVGNFEAAEEFLRKRSREAEEP